MADFVFSFKDASVIINNQIMKNATGENEGTIIAEDLSNLVDVLKVINADSEIDLKNSVKSLIVGIHNVVIDRMVETKQFKMLRDAISYGGGIQRIMQTGLFTAQESHALNLAYAQGVTPYSYLDGKFYGSDASGGIIGEQTESFKVVHSISNTFYQTWFDNAEDLVKWMNSIAIKEQNTIKMMVSNLEQRVINMAIVKACTDDNARKISLIAEFNKMEGRTGTDTPTLTNDSKWTLSELKKYRDEFAYFGSFCKSVVARLVDYVARPSKKYNDGSILTWTPTSLIGCIINTQFATDLDFLATPVEFHSKDFTVDFQTIDTWQDFGGGLLPDYDTTTKIVMDGGTGADVEVENVVGFIYDAEGIGATSKLSQIGYEDVSAELFANVHNHQAFNYYVDPRLNAVALVLE